MTPAERERRRTHRTGPGGPVFRDPPTIEHRCVFLAGAPQDLYEQPRHTLGVAGPLASGLTFAQHLDEWAAEGWQLVSHSDVGQNPSSGWGVSVVLRREVP